MSVNIDPEKIYERLTKVGEEWAAADGKASLMEETFKSALYTKAIELLDHGKVKSMSEAEARARADEMIRIHISKMVGLRQEANEAKVRYAAAQAWFEALRTKAATLRQEMKALGSSQ